MLTVHKEAAPRELKKSNDTDFDRIYKYYHNSKTRIVLSEEEETIRERWEKAWFLLCKGRTTKHVSDLIQKLYKVGRATSYDDVRKAQMLFSDPRNDIKEAKRRIVEQQLQDGAALAWRTGNLEMHQKYLKEISEINGLKEPAVDGNLAEIIKKLKPTQINIMASMQDLQSLAESMREEITHNIPFENVEGEN